MEHINGLYGTFARLLEAKDQIDPLMQIISHQLRFQRLSMNEYKESWISLTPGRQCHILNAFSILSTTEIETLEILKHFGQAEKLRDEFLDIRGTIPAGQTICGVQSVECAVRQIKVVV